MDYRPGRRPRGRGVVWVVSLDISRKVAPTNTDYEGTIVDRWADYAESDQGSRPRLRLVVESQDGKRFTVKVDPNVYESARVGMRIRSKAGQVMLVESSQPSVGK